MNVTDLQDTTGQSKFPVIVVDNTRERQAWEAYQAFCFAERCKPYLRDNPYWTDCRDQLWTDWFALFEVV